MLRIVSAHPNAVSSERNRRGEFQFFLKGGSVMDILFWAISFVLFVIAEVATVQFVSIWFAAGAFVTLIFTFFFEDIDGLAQLGIFVLVSGLFLAVTFPWLKKYRKSGHVSTNAELDVGKSAEVIEEINQDKGTGRVTLNGVNWSAVPAEKGDKIPVGTIVTVLKVQGAKLIVEPKS